MIKVPKISNSELLIGDTSSYLILQLEIGELQNPYSDQEDGDEAQHIANQQDIDQVSTGLISFDQTGMSTNSQQLSAFTRLIAEADHNSTIIGEEGEVDYDAPNTSGNKQSHGCLETGPTIGSSDDKVQL